MPYDSAIALDQVSAAQLQHEVVVNGILNAAAVSGLFGVRYAEGLSLTLYGGNLPVDGTIIAVDDQTIRLTASATNYLYATAAGVVTKVTSPPAGWPGPLAASALALYQLTVGTDAITSGTRYGIGPGFPGATGATGDTGPAGDELYLQRKRIWETTGSGSTAATTIGFDVTVNSTPSARTMVDTSLQESIAKASYQTGTGADQSAYVYATNNLYFLGNAAGRGGFKVSFRWMFDTTFTSTDLRSFFGLYDITPGVIPISTDPSTLVNLIGVGADHGEANYSLIHNDGTGSATKTTLGSNFPQRATTNVYELTLESAPNSGTVTYTLVDQETGNTATGTVSTNLPASTQFLTWIMWINNGSSSNNSGIYAAQVVGYSRY